MGPLPSVNDDFITLPNESGYLFSVKTLGDRSVDCYLKFVHIIYFMNRYLNLENEKFKRWHN